MLMDASVLPLSEIVDATPDFVAVARLSDGAITYLNTAARRVLTAEATSGTKWESLCPHWVRERATREWVPEALTSGSCRGEAAILSGSGSEIPVSFTLTVHKNAAGEPEFVSAIARELTEAKRARELLRAVIQTSPTPIVAMDLNHSIWLWNPAAERMFGWTAEEVIGGPLPFVQDDKHVEHARLWEEVLQTSGFVDREATRVRKDGTVVELSISTALLRDSAGAPIGIVSGYADLTERKRLERELKTTANRFRLALSNSPTSVFEQDLDLRYTWAYNDHPLFAPELLIGKTDSEANPGPWWEEITPIKRRILETGVGERHEFTIPIQGVAAVYDMTLEPLRDAHGRIVGLSGSAVDITGLKRIQNELQVREEQYRFVTETLPQIVWTANPEGVTEFLNRHWYAYTGADRSRSMTEVWREVVHPDDLQGTYDAWFAAAPLGEPYELEFRLRRASDGAYRWHLGRHAPVFNSRSEIEKWIGVALDIHDRREAELEVRESQKRIRELNEELTARLGEIETLLRVIPIGISFSYDPECRVSHVNPAAAKILGVEQGINVSKTGSDAEKLPFRVLRNGVEVSGRDLPMQTAARTGQTVLDLELEVLREDGCVVPVLCSAAPLRAGDGRTRGAVVTMVDISERKAIEDALKRANAALEQFAYAAAHDLQEPARNITIYTQILERRYRGVIDRQADDLIKHIVSGGRRMSNLIEDLLSYTRATDEGPGEARADAGAVLDEVMQNLRTAIEIAHAQVKAESLPKVAVRHAQLLQVFQNLVSNAIKYGREGVPPQIHISGQSDGRFCRFTVRDNGQGIPPEYHERIFRVFKRLHGDSIPGTGIGLAICERIVAHYGGRIWVESEAGAGAAFHFTIPSA